MILPKHSRDTIHKTILGIIVSIMLIITLDVIIDIKKDKFPELSPPEVIADGEIQLKYRRDGYGYFTIKDERHRVNESTFNNFDVGNTIVLESSHRSATVLSVIKSFIAMVTAFGVLFVGLFGIVTGLECYSRWLRTGYWTKKGYKNGKH